MIYVVEYRIRIRSGIDHHFKQIDRLWIKRETRSGLMLSARFRLTE